MESSESATNQLTGLRVIDRFSEKLQLGVTPLMFAARFEDLESCLALVESGQDPKATTKLGVSVLHFAALNIIHGSEIISHFLGLGLDLSEAKDVDGEEPIMYTCRVANWALAKELLHLQTGETNLLLFAVTRNCLELVQRLHDTNGLLIKQEDRSGRNALHLAAVNADLKMCSWLMEQRVGAKSLSRDKSNALHFAAMNVKHGKELVRHFVVQQKLDVYARNTFQDTPLHVALMCGNTDTAQSLLELGVVVSKCDRNMLLFCVKSNNLRSAKFVLEKDERSLSEEDAVGRNALHVAAECADVQMCRWLIGKGLDPKGLARAWKTSALHHVGFNKAHGKQLVGFFAGLGLDLNRMDEYFDVPLYLALTDQNTEVAAEMIRLGASVTHKTGPCNLLHLCVMDDRPESVRFLLSAKPDLAREPAKFGQNALHLAAKHASRDVCELLCVAGVDVHASSGRDSNSVLHFAVLNEGHGVSLVEYFVGEKDVDVNRTNRFFETALHEALKREKLELAEMLLTVGADINVKYARENLLHYCAYRNKLRSAQFVLSKNAIFLDAVCFSGMTALHVAAKHADLKFCKFLVEKGINIHALDSFNKTALSYVPITNFSLRRYFRSLGLREYNSLLCIL